MNKRKMKTASIVIIALMLFSIFAAGFVIAENEEIADVGEISDSTSVISDTNEAIAESEKAIAKTDERVIGLGAATLAEGWSISSDNTKAEITTGIWISKKYLKVDASKAKEIRDKYNGDKAKIIEELKKLTSETQTTNHGRLNIGIGINKEKFKLFKKGITDEKASFYVVPILKNTETTTEETAKTNSIGTLELTKKQYPSMALWTGKLVLNSGTNKGEWNVNLASKTKLFKNLEIGEEVKQVRGGIEAEKKKFDEVEKAVREARKSWWQFWKKAKK